MYCKNFGRMNLIRILSIFVLLMFIMAQIVCAKDYSDYPQRFWDLPKTHWAYSYVSELVDKNVISGYTDGSFKPESTVLRGEWAKMLVVASGKQPITLANKTSYAADYGFQDWYYGYINAVVDYMNFYQTGNEIYFKPNQAASREDVTVSLVKLKGYSIDSPDYSYISSFKDINSISNEMKKYIAVAVEKGLITGFEDGTFRGQDTLTRAEAATLLCRAFQLGNDNKVDSTENVYINDNTGTTIPPANTNTNTTPAPTEKEEEKEPEKPYIIRTLAKAKISSETSWCYITFDNDDNIYYYDSSENTVIKLNTVNGKTTEVMDCSEPVSFRNGDYYLKEFQRIFYDKEDEILYLGGKYECVDEFTSDRNRQFLAVDVLENKAKYNFPGSYFFPNVIGVTGDWWWLQDNGGSSGYNAGLHACELLYDDVGNGYGTHYYFFEDENSRITSEIYYAFDLYDNGNMYFITHSGIYEYDYSSFEMIIKTSNNPVGYDKSGFYIGTDSAIVKSDFSGKTKSKILFSDVEIKDKKPMITTGAVSRKMFVNSQGSIVVYDHNSNAFRIINENN